MKKILFSIISLILICFILISCGDISIVKNPNETVPPINTGVNTDSTVTQSNTAAEFNTDTIIESVTDTITESVTDPNTDAVTETEKPMENETETETEKVTETEKPTETEKVTETEEVTETEKVTGTEKPTETESEETENTSKRLKLASNLSKIKLLGRSHKISNGIACDHTASGIEFRGNFEGEVKIRMNATKIKDLCEEVYFTVYIDGVRQEKRYSVRGTANIVVANFATKGEHTISIVKQTENNYNLLQLFDIVYTGEFLDPPANNDTYIEIIGDSLTCGMGNIGTNDSLNPGTALWEDGTKSYGFIVSKELGADWSIISQSGIGLSASWDDPMLPFYKASSYNRDTSVMYDFSTARIPDMIVINLGTNDYYISQPGSGHASQSSVTPAKFKERVIEFIQFIRGSEGYGKDIPIVWVSKFVGIGSDYVNAINGAISELGGENAGLYRLDVTQNTGGAQWHPDVSGHEKAADELLAFIKSKKILEKSKENENVNSEIITLNLAQNASAVKHLGRTMVVSNGIACDHTATGIEFKGVFEGDVKIKIRSTKKKDGCDNSYFTVYIDGKRQDTRFTVPQGRSTLTIASFAEKREHTIRIVKQTEANYTICELESITFKGELKAAPANNDLYIEFIGDSLTCGMGNIGTNSSSNPQTSPWEDGSQSYGYLTAEAIGADYTIISEAGIGISGSWFDPLFDFYKTTSYKRSRTRMYDFARTPDLIVINLGTNDFYINKDKEPKGTLCTTSQVTAKTKEFIELVRGKYGKDVTIVWVSKFVNIGDNYIAAIEEGIRQYAVAKSGNGATGESVGIYRLNVTQNTGGAQYHPNVAGHITASNELIRFLDRKNLLPQV